MPTLSSIIQPNNIVTSDNELTLTNKTIDSPVITVNGQPGNPRQPLVFDDNGSVTFGNGDSFSIPAGGTAARPAAPATGELRYNTDTSGLEQYNGTSWASVVPSDIDLNSISINGALLTNGDSLRVPSGTTAQRPSSPSAGEIRYNTDNSDFEQYDGNIWSTLSPTLEKASLDKTFTTNESAVINLSQNVNGPPIVSVSKEIPQTAVTNNDWFVTADRSIFDLQDTSYNADLIFNDIITGWALDKAKRFTEGSVNNQDASPFDVAFKPDGTKMYMLGGSDQVFEYDLTLGEWTINSVSFIQSFSIQSQTSFGQEIQFKPDGTKMFVMDEDNVLEYIVSTPWDISSAFFSGNNFSFQTGGNAKSFYFKPDGTEMYVLESPDTLYEYYIPIPWDITSASYSGISFTIPDVVPEVPLNTYAFTFKLDGSRIYVLDVNSGTIHQFYLSTPWNITTAFYSGISFEDSGLSGSRSIDFNPNGNDLFVARTNNGSIESFKTVDDLKSLTLSSGSFSQDDVNKIISTEKGKYVISSVESSGDASYITINNKNDDLVIPSGEWSMTKLEYDSNDGIKMISYPIDYGSLLITQLTNNSFDYSSQSGFASQTRISNDGYKLYITDSNDVVFQYDLLTPWDITSAAYSNISFDIGNAIEAVGGIVFEFKNDGTKLYVSDKFRKTIYELNLATPWDIASLSYSGNSKYIGLDVDQPEFIAFKYDGTKAYIFDGNAPEKIHEYDLSIPWDVNFLRNTNKVFDVTNLVLNCADMIFNHYGNRLYLIEESNGTIYQYNLSTPWDISTVSYSGNFLTPSNDVNNMNPFSIALKYDESKMYITDINNDRIYEFSLLTNSSNKLGFFNQYISVITKNFIDSTFWVDINDITVFDSQNKGMIHYAISKDDQNTFSIVQNGLGTRAIVRNNSGTWQYNSNETYSGETWENSSSNNVNTALEEAVAATPQNIMTGEDFSLASDSDYPSVGDKLDLAMIFYLNDADAFYKTDIPFSKGITINYDSNTFNTGAKYGVDYEWDQSQADNVRITSLSDENLKIRII